MLRFFFSQNEARFAKRPEAPAGGVLRPDGVAAGKMANSVAVSSRKRRLALLRQRGAIGEMGLFWKNGFLGGQACGEPRGVYIITCSHTSGYVSFHAEFMLAVPARVW